MCADNWFTTITICKDMYTLRQVYVVGTIKSNKLDTASGLVFRQNTKVARGSHRCFISSTMPYLRILPWKDTKVVHMISTFPSDAHKVSRRGAGGIAAQISCSGIITNYTRGWEILIHSTSCCSTTLQTAFV